MSTINTIEETPLKNFRFDVTIEDFNGNTLDVQSKVSSVKECSDSITVSYILNRELQGPAIAVFLGAITNVGRIIVDHKDDADKSVFSLAHTITDFDGWSISSMVNSVEFLTVVAKYSSTPSVLVQQSVMDISKWISNKENK